MTGKYVSDFVKRMKKISKIRTARLVWCSEKKQTYVKNKHGKLA